jgi:hypothetical protein
MDTGGLSAFAMFGSIRRLIDNTANPLPASKPPPSDNIPTQLKSLCPDIQNCTDTAQLLGYFLHPRATPAQHVKINSTPTKPSAMIVKSINDSIKHVQGTNVVFSREQRFQIAALIA